MKGLRRILKISATYIDRTQTNDVVLQKANETGTHTQRLSESWKEQKLKLLGHILLADHSDPLRQVSFESGTNIPRYHIIEWASALVPPTLFLKWQEGAFPGQYKRTVRPQLALEGQWHSDCTVRAGSGRMRQEGLWHSGMKLQRSLSDTGSRPQLALEAARKEPFRGAGGSLETAQKDCAPLPLEGSGEHSLETVQKDCAATAGETVQNNSAGHNRRWKEAAGVAKAKLHTRGGPGRRPALARAWQGRRIRRSGRPKLDWLLDTIKDALL